MSSASPFPQHPPGPLTVLESLAQRGVQSLEHVLIGAIAGYLIARALRRRHLHWSWAAAGAPAALALSTLAALGAAPLIAVLAASALGRRWHRRDVHAGMDLARIASARVRPLEAMERALRRLALRRRLAGPGTWVSRGRLVVGVDERGRPVAMPFSGSGGGEHTLVVGATGSGKTVTQTWIAERAVAQGMGVIVVDPKGDSAMRVRLALAARAAGRRYVAWTPGGSSAYNPYARGSDTEIADKLLAGERFTEPHYLRQAQRYLGHAVRALRAAGLGVSLHAVVRHLDPAQLEELARELPAGDAARVHGYLDSLTARQRSDLAGVRDRLAILAESDVGGWLEPRGRIAEVDLLSAARERSVVYFGLESDRRPLLAAMLGGAIVQDLQTVVAELQANPVPTLVVIDEFSALASEQVVRLFGRARSAGCSLLLGTQELADLRPPGGERLLEQVLGNLTTLVAHRQVVPGSAELVASVAGTRGAWRTSLSSDGRSTRTRTREPLLAPDSVMTLARGHAAVIVLGARRSARVAQILSPAA